MERDIGGEIIEKLNELDVNLDKLIKEKNEKKLTTSSSSGN